MKKYIVYLSMISLLYCTGCYKDEIIDAKPGEPIDPVTNLSYTIAGDQVNLTWELPADYPDDILQPVRVFIRIKADGQEIGTQLLENTASSYTYTPYDPARAYSFTVKLMGQVDTTNPYVSNLRYSLGNTVSLE